MNQPDKDDWSAPPPDAGASPLAGTAAPVATLPAPVGGSTLFRVCQLLALLPLAGWGGWLAYEFLQEIMGWQYSSHLELLTLEIPLCLGIPALCIGLFSRWIPLRVVAVGSSFAVAAVATILWMGVLIETRRYGSSKEVLRALFFVPADATCAFFTVWLARLETVRLSVAPVEADPGAWEASVQAPSGVISRGRKAALRLFTILPIAVGGGLAVIGLSGVLLFEQRWETAVAIALAMIATVTVLLTYGIMSRLFWLRILSIGANALAASCVLCGLGMGVHEQYRHGGSGRTAWGIPEDLWICTGMFLLAVLAVGCIWTAFTLVGHEVADLRKLTAEKLAGKPKDDDDLTSHAGSWDQVKPGAGEEKK